MSDTSFTPGGGPLVPAQPVTSGDGVTTSVTTGGGVAEVSTDIASAKAPSIETFLAAGTLPIGTPIRATADVPPKFDLAIATSEAAACVVGLLTKSVTVGEQVSFRERGLMDLTIAQWNAIVTGATTGLTPQTYYYLSGTGKPFTSTVPVAVNDYIVCLGFALTATVFKVAVTFQRINPSS